MNDAASAGVLVAAALAAAALVLALAARDLVRSARPAALLALGRRPEARAAAEALATSWMRYLPGVADAATYTVALTLHLDGELDAALDALGPLVLRATTGALAPDLRYAVLSLDALTLVLVDRDPARAAREIGQARALESHAEDALVEAHALLSLGREDEADARLEPLTITSTGSASPPRRARRIPHHRHLIEEAALRYLRGAYLLRRGRDTERARGDLGVAVASPRAGVYAARARALLASLDPPREPSTEPDGPSSLAPQVLSATPSRPPRA